MSGKLFSVIIFVLAVALAVMACTLPMSRLHDLSWIMKFFKVMLIVLGTGALTKYLFCCK